MAKQPVHQLLPQSADAELGALFCIIDRSIALIPKCIEHGIHAAHFHIPAHRTIYEAVVDLYNQEVAIDQITLVERLKQTGDLAKIGGAAFVLEVCTHLPTSANYEDYFKILRENHTLREVIAICEKHEAAARRMEDAAGVVAELEKSMCELVKLRSGAWSHTRSLRELVMRSTERLEQWLAGDKTIDMPTGIAALDAELQGFRAPEVTIIAGKPSDGKTALALNIAEYLAIHRKKSVGILSMEMSDDQLTDRLLASMARVNLREVRRRGSTTPQEDMSWVRAASRLADAKIHIRDDGALTIPEVSATLSAWKSQHGLDIAFVDHAQLMRGDGRTDGRTEEVEQISRALKPIAKRLGIPLVVLSQVTETAGGGYKTKNSSALLEDPDNLLTISHSGDESWIVIGKQRDGARNVNIPVKWEPTITRFSDHDEQEPQTEMPILAGQKKGKSR